MSARLEDHRPASGDGSLTRSFVGSWLREIGGWIASAHVVDLLGHAGVSPASARTNLSRLKAKGLLVGEAVDGAAGYRLADEAHPMLARGDRRIYGHRQMLPDDWMVVVFSVPEAQRRLRHQLRAQLTWLGCGSVAPGVWIGPGHLFAETRQVLSEVGLAEHTTLLRTATPAVEGSLAEAVARWWDLPALNARYKQFIARHEPVALRWLSGTAGDSPDDSAGERADVDRQAFADYLHVVDDWRSIPYLDPGLPAELLPDYWVGDRGVALFAELHVRLHAPSLRHVLAVTGRVAAAAGH